MENLTKAIISVMREVKGMEKNSKVGTGQSSYDGTKYADVAEKFNDAMEKNGLCIIPIEIKEETNIERWEEVDPWSKEVPKATKQKQSVFTKVLTKYLLMHESGESKEICGFGYGVDSQDKGAGKATTYALKNALLYTFLTPVGKMDDTDTTHSNDIKTPVVAPHPKALPTFTQANFESAYKKGSKLEDIKKAATVTNEVEQAYIDYVIEQDKLKLNA